VTPEAFRRFADALPEGMLLLSGDGTILAVNSRLAERLRRTPEALAGTPLDALTVDGTDAGRLLEEWAGSTRLSPGVIAVRAGDEVVRFRAEGAVVERAARAAERRILVRLVPKQQVSDHGLEVDEQVRALGAEIARRRRVEHALRHREAELREIGDAMPQMLWTARDDGALDFYNRQWRDYTGLALGDSLGWGWEPVVHPDDLTAVREAWDEGRRAGQPISIEARLRRADGAYRWHLCRAVPLRDTEGAIVRWIGTGTDVEDNKRAEEERRGSAQRWQFLAQASTALAASLDTDQVLRTIARLSVPALADWCSVDLIEPDGSVRRVAVTHADPTKQDIIDMAATYPPDPEARHPRTAVLRTGRSVLFREVPEEGLTRIAADEKHLAALRRLAYGSAIIVAVAARGRILGALTFATTSESGRRYGPDDLAFAEDLAHRAALAIDNARLYAEAQEASRLKDEFLATVSHELRTPLASMMNWVALLRQGKIGPEQVARGLDVLQRSGESQARLIDDILDVSRIVSGSLRLQPEPVEMADVVRDATETVRPAADAKRVRIDVSCDGGGARVVGDPARLQQVVWNLLANSVKFTPEGGHVDVHLSRTPQDVELVVTDDGEGIAPEFLPFVFDRFRQAERVARRRHAGLGLGLAIVKHLVEAHGGQVEAQSEGRGRGATFVVRLPPASLSA
jgi:PAS domain S-box-containing protein